MPRGKAGGVTPIRRQYLELKRQVPDAILFFRLGDFYETFDEDAELVSRELDIVLTSRNVAKNVRVPMAGIPYHALESYLARLIEKGYKVAIAEQIGEPTGRGPMTRKIVRIVTPGTVVEPELLPGDANNYLAAVVTEGRKAGIAYADISTGEFAATELEGPDLPDLVRAELLRLKPAEILHPEGQNLPEGVPGHPSPWPAWRFEFGRAQDALKEHFQVARLEGFGLGGKPLAVRAAGAILQYLQETRPEALALLTGLRTYSLQDFMALDATTRRALELTETIRDGSVRGSLLWVLDRTVTPMGRRLLRQWIHRPLVDPERIRRRLDGVEFFVQHPILRAQVREALKPLADLERLTNRVVAGSAQPRDLVSLRATLRQIPALVELFKGGGRWAVGSRQSAGGSQRSAVGGEQATDGVQRTADSVQPTTHQRPTTIDHQPSTTDDRRTTTDEFPTTDDRRTTTDALSLLLQRLDPVSEALELLERAIAEEPPATLQHTGVIRRGFSPELDRIYEESEHAREWIASLEERERRRTGIKNLKVGYNKVFGYYIEVTKANLHLVPKDYIRKQTLVNAERFITPEMKEYEALVLHAEERIKDLEARLYKEVLDKLAGYRERLLGTARALAVLDALAGLAEVAVENDYVRPEIVEDDRVLEIREGRHPVVEKTQETPFVPNDTVLEEGERIRIITGPNMGGKCVTGDTWVFTEQGLCQIRDLQPRHAVEQGFTPLGIRVRGKDGPRTATHFYTGGRQPTLRVTTRFGFTLEGTPEHKVWVRFPDGREGWKRLGELQPGDVVALAQGMDFWGNRVDLNTPRARNLRGVKRYCLPDKMSEDLAYLLGLLVGDGTLTYTHTVTFSTGDEELGQAFRDIVWKLFGYEAKRKTNGKDWHISSRQIRVFLEELGLGYVQAHEKAVPEAILRAPRAMVVAFLQGLFDTDGHVNARHGRVSLSTTSPILARQVQLLLLNLGIVASLRPKPTTHRLSYRLQIYGEHAARFHQVVGFRLSRKRERARLVPRERYPNTGVPHTQGLLRTVHQRLVQAPTRTVAIKRDPGVEALLYTYLPKGHAPSYTKLEALLRFCQANGVAVPELEGLLARRYLYDVVRTIEPSEAEVFDLSVEEEHAYIANGFISHNSTYLRQTALIVLMAQMGSFVPAREARIGLVDRIFTRIGAQDEIHMGQSTFMVEMMETAHILHHATRRSLVILDEIGRGTSTYDGMAIAWAVVEYLHNHPNLRCRTLFATHYHELTRLADLLPGVRNYHVSVTEHEGQVVFLYKVLPGGADRSYGIHVAQLAGLPPAVIARAREILERLEQEGGRPDKPPTPTQPVQLRLFPETHPLLEELENLDPDNLTPLEALTLLYKWQQQYGKGKKR